ncbi:hypothetical protein BG000_004618 [Podila horticola]|nr:hypothetical protein BG000_004618 [Podila horticola]
MSPNYTYNQETDEHLLKFNYSWDPDIEPQPPTKQYPSRMGHYTVTMMRLGNRYFKTHWLSSNLANHFLGSVTCNTLESSTNRYSFRFRISNKDLLVPTTPPPPPPPPTPLEVSMVRLLEANHHKDLEFIFEGEQQTLSAHKAVLSQWPYFSAMFRSEFIEGGQSKKQVVVKDVKILTFKALLRFMYVHKLGAANVPATVYADQFQSPHDCSFEDLFFAADQYQIQDLSDQTRPVLISQLDAHSAIPFLFRSAYGHPHLRQETIQYIAQHCQSQVSSGELRQKYEGHHNFLDILSELAMELARLQH